MMTFARRFTAYSVLGLAGLFGGGTLLAFMLFLYIGPFKLVDLGMAESTSLLFDACLCLIFFVQHSVMIRRSVRQRLARFIPAQYDAALFAIVSGVVLMLLLVFWQESVYTISAPKGIVRWLLRGVFFFSFAFLAWGWGALGVLDPFGLTPILDHMRGTKRPPLPFIIRGPYRWVRHPLYISMILMIWSFPDLTSDRLLFNVLCTAYFIVGTVLEERDLAASFGEAYLDYKTRVPMLIPFRVPRSHRD